MARCEIPYIQIMAPLKKRSPCGSHEALWNIGKLSGMFLGLGGGGSVKINRY